MLYFSEVKIKKVFTLENLFIGKLHDFIFLAAETPLITKMVVKTPQKETLLIPMEHLMRINGTIVLGASYTTAVLEENELYISKNLLDKQIIDVKGSKVIRVNDVVLQDKGKSSFYVAGVDIGIRGILRWLKLKKYALPVYRFFRSHTHPHYLSWADIQPLELSRGNVQLKKEQSNLLRMRAEDLADYLETTNVKNANKILGMLEDEHAGSVLSELNINYQSAIFSHFSPSKAAKLLTFIDPDEAVDLLLTQKESRREEILLLLSEKKRQELHKLLTVSTTVIGKLLTSEYLTVLPSDTVSQVMKKIKEHTVTFSTLNYVYVQNPTDQLVGVFTLQELLLQETDAVVHNFMTQSVIVAHLTTPRELAIKKLVKYKLEALPVIDEQKRILGIVTFDDMAETVLGYL